MKLIRRSGKKSIPRGKRKQWISFWEKYHRDDLMRAREQARREVIDDPSEDGFRHWNDATKEIKQALNQCK